MEYLDDSPTLAGTTIGNIKLVERLGEGGMGQVYLGLDERLKRKVAVKVVHPDHRLEPGARKLFLREARVLSQLEHPHICRLYDFIEKNEVEYLVLELVLGKSLRALLDEGVLSAGDKSRLADQIVDALVAAHSLSIVHRDLKPENIRVTPEGVAKVLDFGIARREAPGAEETEESGVLQNPSSHKLSSASDDGLTLTALGQAKGTPRYMSPEQARGERVSAASDMYSFGLILFEMYSGYSPYGETTDLASIRNRALWGDIEAVDGIKPPSLAALIDQLTAFRPQDRPGAEIAAEQLRRIWSIPRRRLRILFAAAAAAILAAAAAVSTFGFIRATEAKREAEASAEQAREAQSLAEQRQRENAEVSDFLIHLFRAAAPTKPGERMLSARDILDAGAQRLREELNDQPETRARLMTVVGRIYGTLGLYDTGAGVLEETLETVHDLSDEKTVAVTQALGWIRLQEHNFPAAAAAYRQALYAAVQSPSGTPETVAEIKAGLAMALKGTGSRNEAEKLVREALPTLVATHGEDHLFVLHARENLAGLLLAREQFDEAQTMFEELLQKKRQTLGETHSGVALTLNSLAYLLRRCGDYSGAEKRYRESLHLHEEIFGDNHPDTLLILANLTAAVKLQGRVEEVEKLAREIVRRRADAEGVPGWKKGGDLVYILGSALMETEKYEEAETVFRQGISLFETDPGKDHPMTAVAHGWLATSLLGQGKTTAADAETRKSLRLLGNHTNLSNNRRKQIKRLMSHFENLGADETVAAYEMLLSNETLLPQPDFAKPADQQHHF